MCSASSGILPVGKAVWKGFSLAHVSKKEQRTEFSSFYLELFENSNDAQYILDEEENRFVKVNRAFEALTGYAREALESGEVTPDDLRVPGDPDVASSEGRRQVVSTQPGCYEMRILTSDNEIRILEVSARVIRSPEKTYTLGSTRDISSRKILEQRLQEEVKAQKQRTIEATKASVRIYQLTERIRNAPRLTTALLDAETVDSLLDRSARMLCAGDGLHYAAVDFLLIEGSMLVRRFSSRKTTEAAYDLAKSRSRFARVARGEEPLRRSTTGELVVPLRTRNDIIGVMAVLFDRSEKVLFDDSETVRQGQEDIVKTVASSIGLLIENLRLLAKVKQQSVVDKLTGVHNRRHFDGKLREEFQRARRYGRQLSLVIIDLDFFKQVNDTYGHPQGDRLLQEISEVFRAQCRESDVVCRYGGDEFVLLLPETDLKAAWLLGERLRRQVEAQPFENVQGRGGAPLRMTLSIGVSAVDEATETEEAFLGRTDEALYIAKRNGRNQVRVLPGDENLAGPREGRGDGREEGGA